MNAIGYSKTNNSRTDKNPVYDETQSGSLAGKKSSTQDKDSSTALARIEASTSNIYNQSHTAYRHALSQRIKKEKEKRAEDVLTVDKTDEGWSISTGKKRNKKENIEKSMEEYPKLKTEKEKKQEIEYETRMPPAIWLGKVITNKITFTELPHEVNFKNKRSYFSFEKHKISYGKDFTLQFDSNEDVDESRKNIAFSHGEMRLDLFYKLCQFIDQNRKPLEDYKIITQFVPNVFKAQSSLTPKRLAEENSLFAEAHISFYPNLTCSNNNVIVTAQGGKISLNGEIVTLEQMLNLTNRIPKRLNSIDEICETYLRMTGMHLLEDVQKGKTTPEYAAEEFAKEYYDLVLAIAFDLEITAIDSRKTRSKLKKTLQHLNELMYANYKNNDRYTKLSGDEFYKPYLKGMLEGVRNWKQKHNASLKESLTEDSEID